MSRGLYEASPKNIFIEKIVYHTSEITSRAGSKIIKEIIKEGKIKKAGSKKVKN